MPTWTCQKCGQRVENFGWGNAPWKSHRCAGPQPKEAVPAVPAVFVPAAAPAVLNPVLASSPADLPQEPAGEAHGCQEIAAGTANSASPAGLPAPSDPAEGFFQKVKRSDLSGFLQT